MVSRAALRLPSSAGMTASGFFCDFLVLYESLDGELSLFLLVLWNLMCCASKNSGMKTALLIMARGIALLGLAPYYPFTFDIEAGLMQCVFGSKLHPIDVGCRSQSGL